MPCKDAVIRKYEIAAIQKDIPYNCHGDHDPDGVMFIPLEDLDRYMHGNYQPKPFNLRANAGDWIEITLHNLFDPEHPVPYFDYPRVPLDRKHTPSMRVSLNPQFLNYDPVCDSGINVGYNNREQTVGAGESKKYLWFADKEYVACMIQSSGNMRNHRYHGLFGAILIEPSGARWYRNFLMAKAAYEEDAVITAPGVGNFRECVVMIQNGIRMLDKTRELVKTAQDGEEDVDAEDTGEKGYNYRSERFANRLKKDRRISKIFNSRIHGDPVTPVFKAYTGNRVIFRTMMPTDKSRNVEFAIQGHELKEQPDEPHSRTIPLQRHHYRKYVQYGAEGRCFRLGDYLYRSGSLKWDVESCIWGIFRVLKQGIRCKCKNTCRRFMERICKM